MPWSRSRSVCGTLAGSLRRIWVELLELELPFPEPFAGPELFPELPFGPFLAGTCMALPQEACIAEKEALT